MGARVYDPTLRRWLSPDPLLWAVPELEVAYGEGLNLYAYADNDPVGLIDPQGTNPNAMVGGGGCTAATPDCQRDTNPFSQQRPHELSTGGRVVGVVMKGTLSLATDPLAEAIEAPGKIAQAIESGDGVQLASVGAMILVNLLTRGKGGKVVEAGTKLGKKGAKKGANLDPREIAGKTPDEIDDYARSKGLKPKGADPKDGKGSYIDPETGKQRVLIHPNDCKGPHCHMNSPEGKRWDLDRNEVPKKADEAHLPLNTED